MIKQWYTAREFAEFELDGMPSSKMGVLKKADREEWQWRERNASGGGKEYHVSNLPDKAQISLIEKAVGQERMVQLECHAATLEMHKERGRAKFTVEERTTARISIVSLFNNFRASMNMGVLAAEAPFLKLYYAEMNKTESDIIPTWIFEIYPKISISSLRNWRSIKSKSLTMNDLSSKYGNRKGTGIIDRANDGEVVNFIVALITKQSHLTAVHVRDLCFDKFGNTVTVINAKTQESEDIPFPKIRAFERFIERWKSENKGLYLNLTDPDAYKNKFQVAFGKADAGVINLNQVWEIDASPVDAMCVDGRWNIYSIIDIYSRRTLFSISRTPTTDASLALVRRAILEWGVPDILKTDNGADFVSYQFQNALISLGIEQVLCPPFTPEGKPHVERVFKTLQHDLMPLLPGFIGHNVADRSKIEQSKAFGNRLGDKNEETFAIDMTADELQGHIDEWAMHRYGDRVHGTTKQAPNVRAANWVGSIKKIENERVLDVLLAPIASGKGFRKVTKKGIRTENATFISATLGIHIGDTVFVRHNADDLGRIYVFTAETKEFICEAINHESDGISRKEASAEAKAGQKKVVSEKRKEIKKIQRTIKPRDMIEGIMKRKAEEAENVVSFQPSTPHMSAGIEQAHKALNKFEPTEETSLSESQKAAHEALVEQMAKPAEIITLNSKETRVQRAMSLEQRIDDGARVSDDDHQWLTKYQKLAEYIAAKQMRESFGDNSWFEERGES